MKTEMMKSSEETLLNSCIGFRLLYLIYYYMCGRQPKVILTNVLKTEIGRKYIKTRLITDANLSHAVKLQSDQETSSVGSVEIWQIFSPLHQSLFISKRYVLFKSD